MDRTLRTAATGMAAQQMYVELISNNISNVNTPGFKKVRPEFQDLMYQELKPAGGADRNGGSAPAPVEVGNGTQSVSTLRMFKQGDLTDTGNPLDLGLSGDGFFVLRKPDGTNAFTRDGTFKVDSEGRFVNSQGYLLDPQVVIPSETGTGTLSISRDGLVSLMPTGDTTAQQIGQIEVARFVNPAGLHALGANMYAQTVASGAPQFGNAGSHGFAEVIQGQLESSNVDIVQEMVNLITAQRAYELNARSVKAADDNLNTAVSLKR